MNSIELKVGDLVKYKDYVCAIESISSKGVSIAYDYIEGQEAVEKTITIHIKNIKRLEPQYADKTCPNCGSLDIGKYRNGENIYCCDTCDWFWKNII